MLKLTQASSLNNWHTYNKMKFIIFAPQSSSLFCLQPTSVFVFPLGPIFTKKPLLIPFMHYGALPENLIILL